MNGLFDGLIPDVFYNALAHPVALTAAGLWLFWCLGYIPSLKGKWRTPKGILVVINLVVTGRFIIRVLGIA